jgi:hypothetical protein
MGCTRGQTSIHAYDQISSHMHGGNIINEKIVMMVLIEAWESCITRKRASDKNCGGLYKFKSFWDRGIKSSMEVTTDQGKGIRICKFSRLAREKSS